MNNTQYKTKCQYMITSEVASVSDISAVLGIEPTHFYNKGDDYLINDIFNKPEKIAVERPTTMWSVASKTTDDLYVGLNNHVQYFQSLFWDKLDNLTLLKERHGCNTLFWSWVEADKPLIGITLDSKSLSFLNSIADELYIQTAPIGTSRL